VSGLGAGGDAGQGGEWFDRPDSTGSAGLRFSCTLCGNCCTGPEGYVLVSEAETAALASRLGLGVAAFIEGYTRESAHGRSLIERAAPEGATPGMDCIFLDRTTMPGRAVCGVYEDRPRQCRTWPFWRSNLESRRAWERAKRTCPGMDTGTLHSVQQIRVVRGVIDI